MANIEKGTVSTVNGTTARVIPLTGDGALTAPLVIPKCLRSGGNLTSGVQVVFVVFEDMTGYIVDRLDGEWNGVFPGVISAEDFKTESVSSYNGHKHSGVESGSDITGTPQ